MITNENYFSHENQMKYMGVSQIKSMMACEAGALAELKGEFKRPVSVAMLVGSYVDAHFERSLHLFKAKNPEIFTQKGELKSQYKHAEYIIERIERDNMFMDFMSGEKQVIKTGKINGEDFKIKIDSYSPGKRIVDLKVMKDFEPIWKEDMGKVNFIEAWGYDIQGAVYQAIEGNNLPFYIAAATKEPEPNIEIFEIPQNYLDTALEFIEPKISRWGDLKRGDVFPERCEKCDYCKATKVLTRVVSLEQLQYD